MLFKFYLESLGDIKNNNILIRLFFLLNDENHDWNENHDDYHVLHDDQGR